MMLKYFSVVVSGIGWILCTLGSIFFLLTFHYKLHSIKEPAVTRKNKSIVGLFPKVTFAIVVGIIFVSISLIIFNFRDFQDPIQLHLRLLFLITTLFIAVFKYFIEQNHNLKLYLSVYHQIPPPVLPWQLPENFDPKSVKLNP